MDNDEILIKIKEDWRVYSNSKELLVACEIFPFISSENTEIVSIRLPEGTKRFFICVERDVDETKIEKEIIWRDVCGFALVCDSDVIGLDIIGKKSGINRLYLIYNQNQVLRRSKVSIG